MTIHLNKVNGFGGGNGGGGGSASFPTIVTDSGSSLPATTGFSAGDTFLNTSDKKIYKASAGSYELNTGVSINSTYNPDQKVNIDYTTGYASGFYYTAGNNPPTTLVSKTISNSNSGFRWTGNKEIKIHFKVFDSFVSNKNYGLFTTTKNGYSIYIILKSDGLYFSKVKSYTATYDIDETKQLLSCSWEIDKEYYLKINKNEGTTTVTLSNIGYDQDIILSNTLEITDYTGSLTTNQTTNIGHINERYGNVATTTYPFGVYLLDTTSFDYLVPSGSLNWDNGTDLTDKTEYADKTNGILYLYQDTELIQIPLIDLSNYKLKATTTTIDTASITVSEIKANTNYVFSNNAITGITLSGCETSFEETTIEFTTGSTAPTLTDNSGITWVDGSAPTLNASKSYIIVIFNKLGFVKEY